MTFNPLYEYTQCTHICYMLYNPFLNQLNRQLFRPELHDVPHAALVAGGVLRVVEEHLNVDVPAVVGGDDEGRQAEEEPVRVPLEDELGVAAHVHRVVVVHVHLFRSQPRLRRDGLRH